MKVLISAIACHPQLGSESKVGWDAALAISDIPAVTACHVMTHSVNRDAIHREQASGKAGKTVFHFFGEPFEYHPSRMVARLQSWLIFRKWQARLLPFAATLHHRHRFEITHHVTYVTWRVASPLWQLPVPFVWGPIGGTGLLPYGFFGILSTPSKLFEIARQASGLAASRSRAFLDCATKSSLVVAANEETEIFFRRFRPTAPIKRLSPVFFSPQQMAVLRDSPRLVPKVKRPLHLFAGGNLEGRKGVALALETIAELKQRGVDVQYTFGGHGPELHSLQTLARTLGIEDCVEFHQGFHREEYVRRLKESDIYFLPSFRETTPITLLEAALAGCYPVVADNSGAGEIVRRIGGKAVSSHNRAQIVSQLADALQWCESHREYCAAAASDISAKAAEEFGRAKYVKRINEIYEEATRAQL
jgi:glycosyltransferase involved in cell wall biosynthesis